MSSTVGGTDTPIAPTWTWASRQRQEAQQDESLAKPAGPIEAGTARRTTPTAPLNQLDFEVASRLTTPAVAAADKVTGVQSAERKPWQAGRPEATNRYNGILGTLRTAAARRDAAAVLAERESPAPATQDPVAEPQGTAAPSAHR